MSKHSFAREIVQRVSDLLGGRVCLDEAYKVPVVDPRSTDPWTYFQSAQRAALFNKNPWVFLKKCDTRAVALEEFWRTEEHCSQLNSTMNRLLSSNRQHARVFYLTQHYVSKILGDFFWSDPYFGPGASYAHAASSADLVSKLGTLPECTAVAHRDVLYFVLDRMPHYALSSGLVSRSRTSVELTTTKLPVVPGARFTTVPKTSLTDRCIACEPLGNMLLQRSIGMSISCRLREWGLDLPSRPDEHRTRLLDQGDRFATIDLSSASDTIYYALVKGLLPFSWFFELDKCRSYVVDVEGRFVETHKFSTMGNGFTFELETLLFYSMLLAVRDEYGLPSMYVSAFGDDLLVEKQLGSRVVEFISFLGFQVNNSKTFLDGPFKESCGLDVHSGFNVRPIYLKELPSNPILALYALHNRVFEIAQACGSFGSDRLVVDKRFKPLLKQIRNEICSMRGKLIDGPVDLFGDGVLYPLNHYKSKGRYRYLFRSSRKKKLPANADWKLACALYGLSPHGLVTRETSKKYTVVERYTRSISTDRSTIWV